MSILLHTVKFSKEVSFTDQTGITFVNTTTAETASLVVERTASPARTIQYDVTWAVDPFFGNVIDFNYDGLGNYEDSEAVPMAAATLSLVSCQQNLLVNGELDAVTPPWVPQNTIHLITNFDGRDCSEINDDGNLSMIKQAVAVDLGGTYRFTAAMHNDNKPNDAKLDVYDGDQEGVDLTADGDLLHLEAPQSTQWLKGGGNFVAVSSMVTVGFSSRGGLSSWVESAALVKLP